MRRIDNSFFVSLSLLFCTILALQPGCTENPTAAARLLDEEPANYSIAATRPGLSPRSSLLYPGDTLQLSLPTAALQSGSGSIRWESLSPSVASVSGQGRVTARQPGRTRVIVSHQGNRDTAELVVIPAGTSYYVDAENGRDEASGKSPAEAWRTLARVERAPLQPGDRVLFRRGAIWRGQALSVPASGTAERPLRFGAYGTGAAPVLDGENATAQGTNGFAVWQKAYVLVEDLEIRGYGTGVYWAGCDGCGARRLHLHHHWWAGLGLTRGTRNSWAEDIRVHDVAFNGIAPDGRGGTSSHNHFRRIESFRNFTGIKVFEGATDNTFTDLLLYDNGIGRTWENGQTTSSANMSFSAGSHRNRVERALILRGGAGLETRDSDHILIRDVTIRDTDNAGISFKGTSREGRVEGATLSRNADGIYLVGEARDITLSGLVVHGARAFGINTNDWQAEGSPHRLQLERSCVGGSGKKDVHGRFQDRGSNLWQEATLAPHPAGWLSVSPGTPCSGRGWRGRR